ncbi:MAG: S41 family peptidase, partial [Chitinophagaceae bacterium]
RLFRGILETYHPGLTRFTPPDELKAYFDQAWVQLQEAESETEFANRLSYLINKIHCGHTSLIPSKASLRSNRLLKTPAFPLRLKVWRDSVAVVAMRGKASSPVPPGSILTSINGYPIKKLLDTFFQYTTGDGYSPTGPSQMLSNGNNFGLFYKRLFGLSPEFALEYRNELGEKKTTILPAYDPQKDSSNTSTPGQKRKMRQEQTRTVQIDSSLSLAHLTINGFFRGTGLRKFYRSSFRSLREQKIQHLILDLRSNGGGDANLSTTLTRYLIDHRFNLTDTLYALRRLGPYRCYIHNHFFYQLALLFTTRKKADGYYHFGFYERRHYTPKQKNFFNGSVYIITGGNSYSATTLITKALQGQSNVVVVGEETGGGAYGNSAWMIPWVTLPNTRIRFRLPLFKMVMPNYTGEAGRGILPDLPVNVTAESIRNGIDLKTQRVKELISRNNSTAK